VCKEQPEDPIEFLAQYLLLSCMEGEQLTRLVFPVSRGIFANIIYIILILAENSKGVDSEWILNFLTFIIHD